MYTRHYSLLASHYSLTTTLLQQANEPLFSEVDPPFYPLSKGEHIVTVVASVVTVGLTIAGGIEAFDEAAKTSLAASLQTSLGCYEPTCFLELRVAASSIQIDALLTIPDAVEGSSTATTDIAAAAVTLASTDSSTLSSTLGVTVTATTPATVQQAVSVPIVVAPPPPSPPPSPFPSTVAPTTAGPNIVIGLNAEGTVSDFDTTKKVAVEIASLLLTTDYSLLTTHYLLLTADYLLLTTCYLLLTAYYLLLTTDY